MSEHLCTYQACRHFNRPSPAICLCHQPVSQPASSPTYPPAFPEVPISFNAYEGREGMSLRDWLAGKALPAIVTDWYGDMDLTEKLGLPGDQFAAASIAKAAYAIADAMLAERTKALSHG